MSENAGSWRIGDAERDAAVTELREHHVAGRLDREEFDGRMSTALAARTRDDLSPLFADLPRTSHSTAPAAPATPLPATRPTAPAPWLRYGGPAVLSAIWPLTILACIVLGNWALIAIPIVVSMIAGGRGVRAPGFGCMGGGHRVRR